ncbi:MAG: pyridoxal-phosphate dependent enzyme [Pseudomonadota bacterium]
MKLQCIVCHSEQSHPFSPMCEKCGGLTDIRYDLSEVELADSDNPYERFFDLLPVKNPALLPKDIEYTPLVTATRLGKRIGIPRLYLKNETVLPTGTTKFRMAAVTIPYLYESEIEHFSTSSTGNSCTALAQALNTVPDMRMSIFTGSEFRRRVNYDSIPRIDHYVLEGGSFVEAGELAGAYAHKHGYTSEQGFFDVGRREGLKLAFCEATDQLDEPIAWYVQAVSSGMGVYGSFKAAHELLQLGQLEKLPRLLCVQQESCSPMAKAWRDKADQIEEKHRVKHPHGIAKAILRGDPSKAYPYMRQIVLESKGGFESVSELQIRDARRLVLEEEGIDICFSSAAAIAGLRKSAEKGQIAPEETVVVNLTGRDRIGGYVPDDYHSVIQVDGEWPVP